MARYRLFALMAVCVAAGAAGGAHWAGRHMDFEADPAAIFPEDAPVALDVARPTLVLFVHPTSPSARKALDEVARMQADGTIAVSVRVYRPDGAQGGWERQPVWRRAGEVSGDVAMDPEGELAKRFGAAPAETAVVYAPSGRLLFRGRITQSRTNALARLRRLLDSWRRLDRVPVMGRPAQGAAWSS